MTIMRVITLEWLEFNKVLPFIGSSSYLETHSFPLVVSFVGSKRHRLQKRMRFIITVHITRVLVVCLFKNLFWFYLVSNAFSKSCDNSRWLFRLPNRNPHTSESNFRLDRSAQGSQSSLPAIIIYMFVYIITWLFWIYWLLVGISTRVNNNNISGTGIGG